ncbi:MAG TPA: type II secretion system protein GspJ, partial [Deltaproteobacteria bacterium]|nr:type II secretion system protein GspJ [Deltaproteobacteria bacterium]
SGRDVDSVTFTSAADIGFSRYPGCIREVAYYLEEDEKNKGAYILMRREDPTPHRGESTSGSALEVARNVGALEIVYIDEYGQETEQWDLAERLTLPHRVRITLTLGTGEESVTFTATASLPLSGITLESPQG